MSELKPPTDDRYDESTDYRWGVVEERFDTEEFWQGDETYAIIHKYPDSNYVLDLHSQVDKEVTIYFDRFRWSDGTLWFELEVGDKTVTTGCLDWHIADVGNHPHGLGLVGEWFLEQIDVSEYRVEGECPQFESPILGFDGWAACENIECDATWP